MDVYLSRCIKNWVAKNRPPSDGCQQLMKAVVMLPVKQESWIKNLWHNIQDHCSSAPFNSNLYENWTEILISQSSTWYFHFTLNWRTVN
jgi:hypothetical protein